MGSPKGNSLANLGYSCEQRELIRGWREIWSQTPGTTDPLAPFGVVTLASSGAEGSDAAMGAMRIAQTAGFGVLPSPELPNTFLAQAYDLDDPWGPAAGPCFLDVAAGGLECCQSNGDPIVPNPLPPTPSNPSDPMQCYAGNYLNQTQLFNGKLVDFGANGTVPAGSAAECCGICSNATLQKAGCQYFQYYHDRSPTSGLCTFTSTVGNYSQKGPYSKWVTSGGIRPYGPTPPPPPPLCSPASAKKCAAACAAAKDTPVAMGGIHPRSKKPVGDRLGQAAYNLVYAAGKAAFTGPTLSSCSLADGKLTVVFNASLLAGDKVVLQKYGKGTPGRYGMTGGSYLDVQTNPDNFCMEPARDPTGALICPTWAGGTGKPVNTSSTQLDGGWIQGLDMAVAGDGASITVDLSPLNGTAPTAIRCVLDLVAVVPPGCCKVVGASPCVPGLVAVCSLQWVGT